MGIWTLRGVLCIYRDDKARSSSPEAMRSAAAMAAAFVGSPVAILVLVLFYSHLLALALADGASSDDGYRIAGRVKLGGKTPKEFGLLPKLTNAKVILNGGQSITFTRADGYFSFHNVPAGTHLIEVAALGYFFSPVRVDISARNPGNIHAALTENRRVLHELILEPLREEHYYEIREPFSIWSVVKSPMGLMLGFTLLVIFVMPKLMDSIDPEEMKRAQEEMRAQGIPSISNMLARGS
ncbi:ER membrane protein complex subunit 7 homolog [Zingiber officinale]|uniref:ER membrane protein complex subunit 7 homolog n=1 Tax=Zingiber officinale TaxID=94328 RepID=UPI001C4CA6D4|nr:ER membrane protein complex subunit 7 homolog [Zingiber officinale]